MNTKTINDWNLTELDSYSQLSIDGGKDWVESFGYACGYLCGAATNAAGILGRGLADALAGEIMGGAFK
ncbi:hypothetical protein EXU85_28810 [Spirosoma sp. KCTC 42546]|uniref:hypothetical protein n=1 Tax=Spirosoma sp. KCTC 42546 TaxID=2520506 RepID=UPI001156F8BB|nr:hypothetical protein [Spirosoma sp. KCTC 42546]QDK82394.1 hypothetical protein EXU85_28810 [Spirosoma sp. KCTC 42546]